MLKVWFIELLQDENGKTFGRLLLQDRDFKESPNMVSSATLIVSEEEARKTPIGAEYPGISVGKWS